MQQGQIIGTVGNTGNCQPRPTPSNPLNGTHLHFEVRINGKCVNQYHIYHNIINLSNNSRDFNNYTKALYIAAFNQNIARATQFGS